MGLKGIKYDKDGKLVEYDLPPEPASGVKRITFRWEALVEW